MLIAVSCSEGQRCPELWLSDANEPPAAGSGSGSRLVSTCDDSAGHSWRMLQVQTPGLQQPTLWFQSPLTAVAWQSRGAVLPGPLQVQPQLMVSSPCLQLQHALVAALARPAWRCWSPACVALR